MYFSRKCKITYISHGATIYSEEGRFSDVLNYPQLNDAGQEEVERITDYLRRRAIKNDKIYSSSATRTLQTAEVIAKLYKKDYEILEDLTPRKCGSFNGLTYEQIEQKYPEEFKRLMTDPSVATPDDAESVVDFIQRVSGIINRVVDENVQNRVIIVTHPDVIKAAICDALNIPAA